ncbi:MAG: amidase [Fimbriimonadaceae bacterium]|nr:amidase [Fimbriimonadaceae bacterium]
MGFDGDLSRKEFLRAALAVGALAPFPSAAMALQDPPADRALTLDDLKGAERIAGVEFTDDERRAILRSVQGLGRGFANVRSLPIDYTVEPPLPFVPQGRVPGGRPGTGVRTTRVDVGKLSLEADKLPFLSAREVAALVRSKRLSPVDLTRLYLERLERYDPKLRCVVTLTPELAMRQARAAENEIAKGQYRGPLHGLPYAIKDLFATKGVPTTWGADPYQGRILDDEATVVTRLDRAGAVMLGKFSLGALAMGDVWFRGRTNNPWNLDQGSSGSSAGSACATAAGLCAFSVGTETLGSIVSPSHQCRVTGLRPTYGRISRAGAMAVSWTMDKVGTICREVEDCALVLAALHGSDPRDISAVDRPFHYRPDPDFKRLRIGVLGDVYEECLAPLRATGAKLAPIAFDPLPEGVGVILGVEAAAAFDAFTRGDEIDQLRNSSWPLTYRSNRYVPAVEYLQAQRGRRLAMRSFEERFGDFDLFVAPERGGATLFVTNLTGHPQLLLPFGLDAQGRQRSVSFVGRLYDEATILACARVVQEATGFHKSHPNLVP